MREKHIFLGCFTKVYELEFREEINE